MTPVNDKTDHQIQLLGFQALRKELGVIGLIRFMQQFETGSGDYVKDREEWQHDYTVDTLAEAIQTYTVRKPETVAGERKNVS
jgi:hypothetical protein